MMQSENLENTNVNLSSILNSSQIIRIFFRAIFGKDIAEYIAKLGIPVLKLNCGSVGFP